MRIDDIYAQKCAEPSDINEHLPVLRQLASECDRVTEFGVRSMVSTWALIAGCPLFVDSYDLTSPGDEAIALAESVAGEYGVRFRFHIGDTRLIDIDHTDLLFIDTFHVYQQLKVELERHANKARKFIALHDTETFGKHGEAGNEPGLILALSEFLRDTPYWRVKTHYRNNNGLTVLERIPA